ncbi:trypsin-like peptidase domain-containing protein [Botrimarina sp.]|uniref:S1C family serine protease n=1 Tax=Botrimarina sp. TaxID=2795802 RepID=UPI0032EDB15E
MRNLTFPPGPRCAAWLAAAAALLAPAVGAAQSAPPAQTLEALDSLQETLSGVFDQIATPRSRFKDSPHLREAFRPVVAGVREATVEVRSGGQRVALGGVVGPDGWVVTKASVIRGAITCRFSDGRELAAELVGVDAETDVAMLKVAARGLPTLDISAPELTPEKPPLFVALKPEIAEASEPGRSDDRASAGGPPAASAEFEEPTPDLAPGDWLATVGVGRDPIAVGVLSVLPRAIEKRPGFLGVRLDLEWSAGAAAPQGVRIESVTQGGAAHEAGVQDGDVILAVDGEPTATPEALKEAIGEHNPGDRVELLLRRNDASVRRVAMLRGWAPNPAQRRAYYQNRLGGKLSERRFGFPAALQHDTVLSPDECGGPIVDLDGQVVGFNIARAGRTESYALPASEVRSRLLDLMSGRMAPASADDGS